MSETFELLAGLGFILFGALIGCALGAASFLLPLPFSVVARLAVVASIPVVILWARRLLLTPWGGHPFDLRIERFMQRAGNLIPAAFISSGGLGLVASLHGMFVTAPRVWRAVVVWWVVTYSVGSIAGIAAAASYQRHISDVDARVAAQHYWQTPPNERPAHIGRDVICGTLSIYMFRAGAGYNGFTDTVLEYQLPATSKELYDWLVTKGRVQCS